MVSLLICDTPMLRHILIAMLTGGHVKALVHLLDLHLGPTPIPLLTPRAQPRSMALTLGR